MLAFLYGRFQGVNAVSYRLLLLYSARMLSQSVVSIRDPTQVLCILESEEESKVRGQADFSQAMNRNGLASS